MTTAGRIAGRLEDAFGALWSVGEMGLAALRAPEVLSDPHAAALRDDVRARGFLPPVELDALDFTMDAGGAIRGTNPYRRRCGSTGDRVLARLHRAAGCARSDRRERTLVVLCHCYGIPWSPAMRRLFGCDGLGVDVLTNVMGHHQPGTYLVWPGSGLVSARPSRFVENLRCALVGLRSVVHWLRAREGYDRIAIAGFSIGGHLALHMAHSGDVGGALLYCPVTSVRTVARELGLMRWMSRGIEPVLRRLHGCTMDELLDLADPLTRPLPIPEERLHVVVQRHDALTPLHQMAPLRAKYPRARWTELPGTHLLPLELPALHHALRELVERTA